MIGRFPDPLPDEVFYSVCARFSDHVQYSNKEYIFQELFGDKDVGAVIDLPCHIGYLVSNLPPEHTYTTDIFIDCYTLLPFYSPFLPKERLFFVREQMISGNGKGIHRRAGITTSGVPRPNWLRYCPVCIQMDRAKYGEAYWHRLHQIPGVEVCPVHEMFLENSTIPVQNSFTSHLFASAEQVLKTVASPRMMISSPCHKILKEIALDVSYLLSHPIISPGTHFYREQYLALLANKGFVTSGGITQLTELRRSFIDYYSNELLVLLHCEINQIRHMHNTWLASMLSLRNYSPNPLHHLLLMRFLGSEVETFFHHQLTSPKLFGNGPWPCLNPVCENHQKMNIPVYRLKNKTKGRPTGHFTCDCGFSYSRTGPDHSPEDMFRRDKILSYGHIWETKLRELWTDPSLESVVNF